MVFFVIVLGMAVGNFQLPLLPAGLAVGMSWGGVCWCYIPNAFKMVTEPYHSAANPTRVAGSISHVQLGCGRLMCGSEKRRSFLFPACWMLFCIISRIVKTSFVNVDICAWSGCTLCA